jgi:hypothetical protein
MFVKVLFGNPFSTLFFVIDGVVTIVVFFHYWRQFSLLFGLFNKLFLLLFFLCVSFLNTLIVFSDFKAIFIILNNGLSVLIGVRGIRFVRISSFFSIETLVIFNEPARSEFLKWLGLSTDF